MLEDTDNFFGYDFTCLLLHGLDIAKALLATKTPMQKVFFERTRQVPPKEKDGPVLVKSSTETSLTFSKENSVTILDLACIPVQEKGKRGALKDEAYGYCFGWVLLV